MSKPSKGFAQAVWESSYEGMALTNSDGLFLDVNATFCRITGKSKEELIGKPFTSVWMNGNGFEHLVRAYQRRFVASDLRPLVERKLRLWSGQQIDIEASGSFVDTEDGGKALLTVIRDVSSRKTEQRMLSESERLYHELFQSSVMPMFRTSVDGKIIAANPALISLFGYDCYEELAEVNAERFYAYPEDRKLVADLLESKGYCSDVELRLKKKNGMPMTVVEHSRAVKDRDGKVIMFEGALQDITIKKELEEKLQRYVQQLTKSREELVRLNAQKDRLFSVLSHDLRSPFSSIIGFCEVLMDEGENVTAGERKEYVGYIKVAAGDLLNIVNDLLDWSKVETGRVKVDIRDLSLDMVVERSINALAGLALKKEITLTSEISPNLAVQADEKLLSQMLGNLISNALKFTPRQGLIKVYRISETQDTVTVGITDNGVGIPPGDLSKLFNIGEKYTRTGLSGEQGTGLGLPLCREIAQRLGGAITAKSELGKGTTFLIELPKARMFAHLPKEKGGILVVDDKKGDRALHARFLGKIMPEAAVIFAADGREGLDVARAARPRIIISDYAMPVMNGLEFLRRLKEDPDLREIPVIMISGEGSQANIDLLEVHGARKVMRKPVTMSQLENVLSEVFPRTEAGVTTPAFESA